MRYWSDKLQKLFEDEAELHREEKAAAAKEAEEKALKEKKAAERKARADEVTAAREAALKAQKHYSDVLNAFIKDYGAFHESFTKQLNVDDIWKAMLAWL